MCMVARLAFRCRPKLASMLCHNLRIFFVCQNSKFHQWNSVSQAKHHVSQSPKSLFVLNARIRCRISILETYLMIMFVVFQFKVVTSAEPLLFFFHFFNFSVFLFPMPLDSKPQCDPTKLTIRTSIGYTPAQIRRGDCPCRVHGQLPQGEPAEDLWIRACGKLHPSTLCFSLRYLSSRIFRPFTFTFTVTVRVS